MASTAESFFLEGFGDPIKVQMPDKSDVTKDQLLGFAAFKNWKDTLQSNLALQKTNKQHAFHNDPYMLLSIEVQSIDQFGPNKIGFVKLKADIQNKQGQSLPGIAFLRGGSVAVLIILRPRDSRGERWVVMTEQPRVPAGSLSFTEIPAGMLDDANNIRGKAIEEIKEETGFDLPMSELIDLTALALKQSEKPEEESLQNAMYPSPGGSDEFIPIFLWEKVIDRQEIEDLTGKLAGQRTQGEMITLRVYPYEELWKRAPRDAKTLAAWALYEGLNRAGKIQPELRERRKGSKSARTLEETEEEIRRQAE